MSTQPNPNIPAVDHEFLNSLKPSMRTDPYTDVPQRMQDSPTWVIWKYALNKKGKKTKLPFDVNTKGSSCASTTDSTTWVSFDQAVDAADKLNFEGPGFVFKGNFQGADLDGAIQTIDNRLVINPFALAVAKLAGTYCEYSPSKTGIHLIWESPIPLPEGNRKGNHELGGEIYDKDSPRFFTVSGAKVPGLSTDSVTTITDPNLIKLIHFLVLNTTNDKLTRLWVGAWQKVADATGKPFPSQSEADLALCHILVRAGFNSADTLDAAFRHSGLMREDWDHKSKYTITKALGGKEANASSAPAELVFKLPAVEISEANDNDYVLARIPEQSDENDDGWFPRGEVSLMGAPSGAGKTTTMYQLLLTQQCGGVFLGHGSHGLSFCVMGVDRSPAGHRRTMKRMRMRPDSIPYESLGLVHDCDAVQQIVVKIESYAAKHGALPAIVLLEGVDIMLTKVNDILCVSKFMNLLVQVAAHYHIAIIGTLGAPKIKVGQGYTCLRDNVLGSGGWSRECETMIVIQFPQGTPAQTKGRRVMTVMPRNAKEESFTLGFNHGQLEQVPDIEDDNADNQSEEIEWFQARARKAQTDPTLCWFTVMDMERALKMPHSTADYHIKDALTKRHIRAKSGKKFGRGTAKQYQWNASKSNPIWVAQRAQDTTEQKEAFS
jgi:hypothetical protein